MKVYVVHYTPLTDRKVHIIEQLKQANIIDYEFIETHDKEHLTDEDVERFEGITLPEKSLFLKHIDIFRKEDISDDIVLVLEDDAILMEDFKDKLNCYLAQLQKTSWDVLFGGSCCDLHAGPPSHILYQTNRSRGTCMYVLNGGVCKKIHDIYKGCHKIDRAIDHWFNKIQPEYNLNYLWSEPPLVTQGSEIGVFETSLQR